MHWRDSFELRPRRRQGRAAVSFWYGGDRWLRHEFVKGSRGKWSGAHSDDEGTLGEVGDGPEPTNLTEMAGGPEVEEGIDGGVAVRPGLRGSSRRCFASLRSYWSRWLG